MGLLLSISTELLDPGLVRGWVDGGDIGAAIYPPAPPCSPTLPGQRQGQRDSFPTEAPQGLLQPDNVTDPTYG